jgi:hypothetical protein
VENLEVYVIDSAIVSKTSFMCGKLRGLLTRARIRAPFNDDIISRETRFSDTIDNVKANIDNLKAKTQDEED